MFLNLADKASDSTDGTVIGIGVAAGILCVVLVIGLFIYIKRRYVISKLLKYSIYILVLSIILKDMSYYVSIDIKLFFTTLCFIYLDNILNIF